MQRITFQKINIDSTPLNCSIIKYLYVCMNHAYCSEPTKTLMCTQIVEISTGSYGLNLEHDVSLAPSQHGGSDSYCVARWGLGKSHHCTSVDMDETVFVRFWSHVVAMPTFGPI